MNEKCLGECDVVIVGAGPAGTATALALVREAATWARRIVLVDRAIHPRRKLCGGAVTPLGLEVLGGLGLGLDVPFVAPGEMRIRFAGTTHTFAFTPPIHVVYRSVFDHWLLRLARGNGVRVEEATRVLDIRMREDHAEIRTDRGTLRARVVVAADGSRGPTRRLLGLHSATHAARLLEVFTPSRAQSTGTLIADRDGVCFDFDPMKQGLQGYCWTFPCAVGTRPSMNHGVFDAGIHRRRGARDLRALLRAHLQATGFDDGDFEIEGHPLRWFVPGAPLSRERAILVGDAAGADPLLGEGISFALRFGQVAARAIDDAFRRMDFEFTDYSARVHGDSVLGRLSTRHARARLLYARPPGLALRALWRLGPAFIERAYR